MSLRFFEGPAGSGKTTCLFEQLSSVLEARPLAKNENVLALTKMHGSRRRMHDRLAVLPGLGGRFQCKTIDSFAWRMLRRWRSLACTKGNEETMEEDYEKVCTCAGDLLSEAIVVRWATRTFPVVMVDELQDSKGGQLAIVRALAEWATCLAAADDFQDLDALGTNDAVSWAQESGNVVYLKRIHRTSAEGLLAAATALRDGHAITLSGNGFKVLGARNKNVGASFVSRNLTWWLDSNDIAVITPVRAETSAFVRDLIARVEEKPIGNPAVGPYRIPWEVTQENDCERFLSGLALPSEPSTEVSAADIKLANKGGVSKAFRDWLEQQRCLTGRTTFTVKETRHQARRIHQRSRVHFRARNRGVRAMTVHQAKNREFDSVIILWPYEVAGTADRQRRLLYNAVTRAKRQVLVIVQNPARLCRPPFVP